MDDPPSMLKLILFDHAEFDDNPHLFGHALVVALGTIPSFDRLALVGDCLASVRYGWNMSIRTFSSL